MLFNLAIKNIKKSIKDYGIYFFTLVIAVAMFYIFNSLDSQQSMYLMSESKYQIVQSLIVLLGYISIFVSFILGFLIIYSNSFLIKRRKKEFGLYLTLGMSKRNVSLILVIETLIVGLISLVVGLIIGAFLSQGVSVLTIKMFEIDMSEFRFAFSTNALLKTILYFSIIFGLVMIFNVISLSRNKIINLLTAANQNDKVKFRNKYIVFISTVLSIGFLIYAYKTLFNGGMFAFDNTMLYMIIAGGIGTLLFFFSIFSFFLKIIQTNKKVYFKGLNMFTLKQINSSANKSVISTTMICIMLLFTIGILSGSISLITLMNNDMSDNNKTDFTITKNRIFTEVDENDKYKNVEDKYTVNDIANTDNFKNNVKEYAIYYLYQDENINMSNFIEQKIMDENKKKYGEEVSFDTPLDIISESDYNKIMNLYGEEAIDVKNNEYILTSNISQAVEFYISKYQSGNTIKLNGLTLKPGSKDILNKSYKNYSGASNFGTIIVDDSNLKGLKPYSSIVIGNYINSDNLEKLEKDFFRNDFNCGHYSYTTKIDMKITSIGTKAILTFVGLYIGITFAITSATILAIKELSESNDNKKRFKVLKQIGADEKMINKALFTQITISFITPLVVALIHAYFGLKELNGMIELLGDIDISKNIFLTALFIIIIYGGYFITTYICSKSIIKD